MIVPGAPATSFSPFSSIVIAALPVSCREPGLEAAEYCLLPAGAQRYDRHIGDPEPFAERVIDAATEQQRPTAAARLEAQDASDEDEMVAAFMDRLGPAVERRQHAAQHGAAASPGLKIDIAPFVAAGLGETRGQPLLILRKDAHGEMAEAAKRGQAESAPVEAELDERRIERYRAEGVCGNSDRLAFDAARRDDRDASGKPAHRVAELPRIEGGVHGASSHIGAEPAFGDEFLPIPRPRRLLLIGLNAIGGDADDVARGVILARQIIRELGKRARYHLEAAGEDGARRS